MQHSLSQIPHNFFARYQGLCPTDMKRQNIHISQQVTEEELEDRYYLTLTLLHSMEVTKEQKMDPRTDIQIQGADLQHKNKG